MEQMSIARALAELKLVDKRIAKKIREGRFIAVGKQSLNKLDNGTQKSDFIENSKAQYQSINDLLERRRKIKSAISTSNATTHVEVAGVTYLVSDAIERKNMLTIEKDFIHTLKSQLRDAQYAVESDNEDVHHNLQGLMSTMVGKEGAKDIANMSSELASKYLSDNLYELVDPLGLARKISELEEELEQFSLEVDYALSTSNCLSYISI